MLKRLSSIIPSIDNVRGFGFTGGGVRAFIRSSEAPSLGSGGRLNVRCGFGDFIGGGPFCETASGSADTICLAGVLGRFFSNMLTSAVVGGIGLSSVDSFFGARMVLAFDRAPTLPLRFGGWSLAVRDSSRARTFRALPAGGRTSLPFVLWSYETVFWGTGLSGLYLAAASFAAMFEGDGVRSEKLSSGTPSEFELLDWLSRNGDDPGLPVLLPPVQFLPIGDTLPWGAPRGLPVPTFVAASKAPLFPPV